MVLWPGLNFFILIKLSNEWNPFGHNIVPTEKLAEFFLLGCCFSTESVHVEKPYSGSKSSIKFVDFPFFKVVLFTIKDS